MVCPGKFEKFAVVSICQLQRNIIIKEIFIRAVCAQTTKIRRQTTKYFTDIFSKTGKEGELLEKINYVIGIKVKEVSELPTKVCRKCRGQLTRFSDFIAKALSVQNELALYTTSKRCKNFSPSLEPEKKKQLVGEEKQTASLKPGGLARKLFPEGNQPGQVKEIQKNVNEVHKVENIDAILSKSGLNNPEVIVF